LWPRLASTRAITPASVVFPTPPLPDIAIFIFFPFLSLRFPAGKKAHFYPGFSFHSTFKRPASGREAVK
jgi:hypothetical protein